MRPAGKRVILDHSPHDSSIFRLWLPEVTEVQVTIPKNEYSNDGGIYSGPHFEHPGLHVSNVSGTWTMYS